MAAKRKITKSKPVSVPAVSAPAPKAEKKGDMWVNVGWTLLLVGGLAHMLPAQMAPLLNWSIAGVSLQMAVGVASVVLALYYLLGE